MPSAIMCLSIGTPKIIFHLFQRSEKVDKNGGQSVTAPLVGKIFSGPLYSCKDFSLACG